jgi:hypothetical protein
MRMSGGCIQYKPTCALANRLTRHDDVMLVNKKETPTWMCTMCTDDNGTHRRVRSMPNKEAH